MTEELKDKEKADILNTAFLKDNNIKADSSNPTANDIICWNSNSNIEIATHRLKEMFIEMGQKTKIENGQKPVERAVFRKQHGIAYGTFTINKNINPSYKVGIFAKEFYECAVRFSSDTTPNLPDLNSSIGLGLKLFDVDGPKLFGEGNNADFIFQNIDRFFAKDVQQMCSFTTAGVIDLDYDSYINKNPAVASIIAAMAKEEASCLTAEYWAILPFKLGSEHIVKYRLVPDGMIEGAPFNDNNYLALDLQQRLRNNPAKFRFEIQVRTKSETMPLDDAQAVWSIHESPFICIAELNFPQQDICAIGQAEFGNNLAFNIWRTLEQHEPIGSIAAARKVVYAASAEVRHQANGQPFHEPNQINKSYKNNTDNDSDCIVKAAIFPPIGVMRVGNSDHEYFIGPLVAEPEVKMDINAYRDNTGALKRQAAQFRIYGFNAAGKAVKELTADNSKIIWHAHLANQKSSWYQFQMALDIPDAANAPASILRNINVTDRNSLKIDGGAQTISEPNVDSGHRFAGKFQGHPVYLGEMRTDKKGRLIMLGGHGISENLKGDIAITFANNEGWYDDISDGPVTANIEYNGVQLKVDPAWVICAPPNYAPMQKSVRTMWDLMRDVAVTAGILPRPIRPSFTEDILPIFQRMTNLQWVNAGFAAAFGWGGQFDYTTAKWIVKLNDPSSANLEMRRTISNNFRRYDIPGAEAPQLWPWMYGDAINIPSLGSVRQHSTLSTLQLAFIDQWVKGDFDADYVDMTGCPHIIEPITIDKLPIAEQPDMLTKAAMEFCLADAFHPGCEMTWPMRNSAMYMSAFRLKHSLKIPHVNSSYYGPVMNGDILTLAEGPILGGQSAGGITRWKAIPWQTDTASCLDGYSSPYDPYLPTFWPARVPNNFLGEDQYKKTLDSHVSEETRKQAFTYRRNWLDDLPLDGKEVNYTNKINSMVKYFDKLAVVQPQPGVLNNSEFPSKIQVGILPNAQQEAVLLNEALIELKAYLHTNNNQLNENLHHLIKTIVNNLSDKNLLNKQELINGAKDKLFVLVKQELDDDFKLTPNIQKLLTLLSSKAPRLVFSITRKHQEDTRKDVGITEKSTRFSTYQPK